MTIVPGKLRDDEAELTTDEEKELQAALEEADRDGGGIPAEQFLQEMRAKYGRR
jgi:hypothetical protein